VPDRIYFCKQFASHLVQTPWQYRTLLAASIECVKDLPNNADKVINELLVIYPQKPTEQKLRQYLNDSDLVYAWFRYTQVRPSIARFNLDPHSFSDTEPGTQPPLATLADLAQWLDIDLHALDWYADLHRFDASKSSRLLHYHYQLLQKRRGGMRLIEKPKSNLKRIQRKINAEILSALDTHPAAHGFCAGRSCQSHASVHVGKHYLMLFDIAECFHSIGWLPVESVFRRLGYPESVAKVLTALCTHQVRLPRSALSEFDESQKDRLLSRHLPQGAPTSPALVNAVLHTLDLRLTGLASSLGLNYSRYADDMAFSGNRHRDWRFLEPLVGSLCLDEGVCLNYRKSRIKRAHQQQKLVGIVVNRSVNVDRHYFDQLKAILFNCVRHGLESQNIHAHPHFRAHLLGRIQYVKSLNKNRGIKLEELYSQIKPA